MNYSINPHQLKDLPIKTIELLLQENYDKKARKALSPQSSVRCTSCGSKEFKYHGSYERYVYLDKNRQIILKVMRKMCLSCHKTRVFLPSYLVKYKRYTLYYLFRLVRKIEKFSMYFVNKKLKHCFSYLSYIYDQYLNQHQLRMRVLKYKDTRSIKGAEINAFLKKYRELHRLQFLQIKIE